MKAVVKSCLVLLGASVASAHHHGQHGKRSVTHTTTEAPPTVAVPDVTTEQVIPSTSGPGAPPLPASPVMKQMIEKAEQQQAEEVADVFYRMFYGGHIQGYGMALPMSNDNTVSPVKGNSNCVNCNEEKRYRDFDYQYKPNGGDPQTCYAIQRSDEGYGKCQFEDISTTGTDVTSSVSGGAAFVPLSTSFPFYDRQLTNPTAQIFVNGFVTFSSVDPSSLSGNTLPNPSEGPFNLIAPYYQAQTLSTSGSLVDPVIYVQTSSEETIIQWETNEEVTSAYAKSSQGASIYQVKISSSGAIAFAYNLATCEIPSFTTVQVGVKPLQTELQEGYRTSFFQSACQDGAYFAPCPGMSVVLKRVKCESLIGQTGIKKPKMYKKKQSYKKDQDKSYYKKEQDQEQEYQSKKQYYVNHFHQTASKLFSYY